MFQQLLQGFISLVVDIIGWFFLVYGGISFVFVCLSMYQEYQLGKDVKYNLFHVLITCGCIAIGASLLFNPGM